MKVTVEIDLPPPPKFYVWSKDGAPDTDFVCLWYEGGAKPVIVGTLQLNHGSYWEKAVDMLVNVTVKS